MPPPSPIPALLRYNSHTILCRLSVKCEDLTYAYIMRWSPRRLINTSVTSHRYSVCVWVWHNNFKNLLSWQLWSMQDSIVNYSPRTVVPDALRPYLSQNWKCVPFDLRLPFPCPLSSLSFRLLFSICSGIIFFPIVNICQVLLNSLDLFLHVFLLLEYFLLLNF